MAQTETDVETAWLHLKAPVTFFERIDDWCERAQREQDMIMRPSRPAAIRYMVDQFLKQEERQRGAKRSRKRRV